MAGNRTMTLQFPDFRGFIRGIILACTAVYAFMLLLQHTSPILYAGLQNLLWLMPYEVVHGWVWQLVSYSFLHGSLTHLLFNMLTLWFVGAYLEASIGKRRVAECYFLSVVGAAIVTVALFYTRVLGMNPLTPTVGASGGIYGLLVAFAVLFGEQSFYMFPLPFSMKAKYLVTIYIVIAALAFLGGGQEGTANLAHLGGALFGYVYIKLLPKRTAVLASGRGGLARSGSEAYYGIRNAYHRWKRKRAAKKFEVYMRKHGGK